MDGETSPEGFVKAFWKINADKLNPEMLRLIAPDDIIISASPIILFDGIREKLNTNNIVGTEVDLEQKEITWFNFGDNKVKRYRELYGDKTIDMFYTDSYNDRDLMEISKKVFIVKRGIPVRKR